MAPYKVRAASTMTSLSTPDTLTSTERPWPMLVSKIPICRLTPNMPGIEFITRVNSGIISRARSTCSLVPPNRVMRSEET